MKKYKIDIPILPKKVSELIFLLEKKGKIIDREKFNINDSYGTAAAYNSYTDSYKIRLSTLLIIEELEEFMKIHVDYNSSILTVSIAFKLRDFNDSLMKPWARYQRLRYIDEFYRGDIDLAWFIRLYDRRLYRKIFHTKLNNYSSWEANSDYKEEMRNIQLTHPTGSFNSKVERTRKEKLVDIENVSWEDYDLFMDKLVLLAKKLDSKGL